MVGDVVGRPGRRMIVRAVPKLIEREQLDLVVVNAENCAGGSGLTPANFKDLRAAGVDAVTLGDHIYRRSEIRSLLESDAPLVKPANFPPSAPGKTFVIVPARNGVNVAVVSLLGRVFMRPVDCPFLAADRVLKEIPAKTKVRVVDMHAEATSDKQLLGRYLDGRVSAVVGTHTHVATADECVLPGGTAFQCDLGMTGPHDGVLGREYQAVVSSTLSFVPANFDVSQGDARLNGSIVEVDEGTGKATSIRRLCVRENEVDDWYRSKPAAKTPPM